MRLKELRIKKGLSLLELSLLVGVSDQTISNWERGKNEPNIENIIKLANIFNVSIDYLLGRTDNESNLDSIFMNAEYMDADELRKIVLDYLKDVKIK